MTDTRLIAHRGASGWAPEHTETAIRLAARLGADAVEPDLVASRDGVLVVRHDVELGETTDIADRPELADRRTTRAVDGHEVTGWFAQDLDWAEIATLRARERLPLLRPLSATRDGRDPVLRLEDLLRIADEEGLDVVAELKHAAHHEAIGLPLDALLAEALAGAARAGTAWSGSGRLVLESFEESALHRCRERGIDARLVYLMGREGAAADLPAGGPSLRRAARGCGARGARRPRRRDLGRQDGALRPRRGQPRHRRPRRARLSCGPGNDRLDPAARERLPRVRAAARRAPGGVGRLDDGVAHARGPRPRGRLLRPPGPLAPHRLIAEARAAAARRVGGRA
ncbi:glycerophosphodiester phosphodiesterase family protein [Agrococcus sp. SL85]|uniref:glycerophosphodiester phosphodiesterase family protein n=1 Tax=Agrococcus sp. SL85 TaxID=2995141 RepID=UPI002D1E3C2D|nr:glycerophosphodiester phosphodiesterase family protein [Agrococcus sp. SL85]